MVTMAGLASVARETHFVKILSAVVLKGHWNLLLRPQIASNLSSLTVERVLSQLSLYCFDYWAFYEWVEKVPGYKHSLEFTWVMLHMLTKQKNFRIAQDLLNKIARRNISTSSIFRSSHQSSNQRAAGRARREKGVFPKALSWSVGVTCDGIEYSGAGFQET